MCRQICWLGVFCLATMITRPAQAAFHLWTLNEIYTNSSGSLQFIELKDPSGGQNIIGGQQISVSNVGNTQTHVFTLPAGNLPGNTFNHDLLFGTTAIQASGGPSPDFIIPDNFLFSGGGTINFFGANSGAYSALPTDSVLSRTWAGGDAVNSPQNFAGQVGVVPEPSTFALSISAAVCFSLVLLRRRAARLRLA